MAFTNHRQRHERRHEQRHVRSERTLAAVHRCEAGGHADYRGHAFRHDHDGRRQFGFRAANRWQYGVGEGLALQYTGNSNAGDANDAPAAGRLTQRGPLLAVADFGDEVGEARFDFGAG